VQAGIDPLGEHSSVRLGERHALAPTADVEPGNRLVGFLGGCEIAELLSSAHGSCSQCSTATVSPAGSPSLDSGMITQPSASATLDSTPAPPVRTGTAIESSPSSFSSTRANVRVPGSLGSFASSRASV